MKALQTRQSIIHEYERIFQENDLIMTPTMPFISPRFSDIAKMRPLEMYQADFLTVPPNLAGVHIFRSLVVIARECLSDFISSAPH